VIDHPRQPFRRPPRPLSLLWLVLIAAAACSRPVDHFPLPTAVATAKPLAVANPATPTPSLPPDVPPTTPPTAPPPSPSPTVAYAAAPAGELAHYTLDARFDYDRRRLDIDLRLDYPNRTGRALDELLLVVEANRWPGVFHLHAVAWGGGRPLDGVALDGRRLILSLPRPLPPGQSLTVNLAYTLRLPPLPGPFGYTDRQTNLGDWYPFVPPYLPDSGWLVREPAAVGEHLVYDLADYTVRLSLAGADPPVVAGPAEPDVAGQRLAYHLPAARGFAWSASREYERHDRPVDPAAGQPAVTFYAFPEHRRAVSAVLETAAQSAALFSRLFGPYPRPGLTVVEADFDDGMEYDGLFFLDWKLLESYPGDPQGYLVPITAHETAHQWWYGLVANDPALEPWLDEALCTYSELLYYRAYFPELEIWWWWFRVNRFEPAGPFTATIYDFAEFRPYVDAVYLNGARYLDELRLRMGDDAFLAFLGEYAAYGRGRLVTAADFYDLLAAYGVDQPPAAAD
jgi:hypothetical protein